MDLLLTSVLTTLLLAQPPSPPPAPAEAAMSIAPAGPVMRTPTDDFGPELKAWLDAAKLKDQESAARALMSLQRLRAERNITTLDDVAGAISGRAEVLSSEGTPKDAAEALDAALSFAPESASDLARKAAAEGNTGAAWSAVMTAWNNPLEQGRLVGTLVLGFLTVGALFSMGFALALVLRYAAVFGHDVEEGLSDSLKSLALFMAVMFMALPLAGFLGWGYLPFWWLALFFIFQSRQEKTVSIVILAALALASLLLPMALQQRAVASAPAARPLSLVANGGVSVEGEALVLSRLAEDPTDLDWSLLAASLSRRAGRFDEASATLQTRASGDARYAHNAAALSLMRGDYSGAIPGFTQAAEGSLRTLDRATGFYNLSIAQANTLAFEQSKASRQKGDALDAAALARFDRLFAFDRDGSRLQAPPDIVPEPSRVVGSAIPAFHLTAEDAGSRLAVVAIVLLLFIPGVVKFRGAQSFSKQCPKCGTTFCWLCQTRSTSQDVCSQCHHLFVVKRGIPPAARAAKTQEIARYTAIRAMIHRVASLAAPGSGHLSVGHFFLGLPLLLVWALSVGTFLTVQFLAPHLVSGGPFGGAIEMGAGALALLAYVLAQVVKPRPPVVAVARRAPRAEEQA